MSKTTSTAEKTGGERVRPNLLFITTDQQRYDTIAALGARHMLTPHMDWLAETGIVFEKAYADAPLCAPARATMITGRHYLNMPDGHGHFGQPTAPDPGQTLPAILTRNGYQTKSVGKLHYHPVRANYGWEHTEILADYYWEMERHPERGVPMDHGLGQNELQPSISTVDESHSLTRWTVERAARFLETRDTTRPFCLHVGFSKPHPPLDPCRNYWDLYADLPQPDPVFGNWSENVEDIPASFMRSTWSLCGADRFSPAVIRACRRAYAALVTQIDYNLGILLTRLRELDLLENTVIVFCSDHGEMLGDHHMAGKTIHLEGAAHVPMILRLPDMLSNEDVPRGSRCGALASHADIMPTLLRLAGVEEESLPDSDGLDLLALAAGEAKRESLVAAVNGYYALVESRYKYVTSAAGGEFLFDLVDDPCERRELIRGETHGEEHKRMQSKLLEEIKARNMALPGSKKALSRAEVRANPWPGFHHRTFTGADVLH